MYEIPNNGNIADREKICKDIAFIMGVPNDTLNEIFSDGKTRFFELQGVVQSFGVRAYWFIMFRVSI